MVPALALVLQTSVLPLPLAWAMALQKALPLQQTITTQLKALAMPVPLMPAQLKALSVQTVTLMIIMLQLKTIMALVTGC